MKGNTLQKEAVFGILSAIRDFGFRLFPYEEDCIECGFEFEDWTPNGVDMCCYVDLRNADVHNPFDIAEEIRLIANDFDPDEEVRIHMQDDAFRSAFTYRRAGEEFENWKQHLENLASCAEEALENYIQDGLREDDCVCSDFSIAERIVEWNMAEI